MTQYPFTPRRCPRGHPIDSDHCFYCDQEDREQDRRDDKLLEQLKRLAKRGKLQEVLSGLQ